MRPCCRRTPAILQAYVSALLLVLSAKADGEGPDCEDEIKVHRGAVYNVSLGESFKIPCPVKFCQNSEKIITWSKLEGNVYSRVSILNNSDISAELIMSSPLEGTSFLKFNNIQVNDSGFYQCSSEDEVSFKITLTVSGNSDNNNNSVINITSTDQTSSDHTQNNLLKYIYTSAGIVAFVVLVIVVSVFWMRGCRGKPETQPERDVQYAAVLMRQRPPPRRNPPTTGSRGSSRRSSQRQTPAPLPRGREMTAGGEQGPKTAEEHCSLVYAALNQQPLENAASSRPCRPTEENSEYAAIRVS